MFTINLFSECRQNALKWGKGFCFLEHDIRIKMSHMYQAGEVSTLEGLMKFLFKIYPDIPLISTKKCSGQFLFLHAIKNTYMRRVRKLD